MRGFSMPARRIEASASLSALQMFAVVDRLAQRDMGGDARVIHCPSSTFISLK